MNISTILDNIKIIQGRRQIFEQINPIIPCIELYEFELKGYAKDRNTLYKMGDVTNSSEGECGSIKVTNDDYNKSKISSCDILSSEISQNGGLLTWKNFYSMYKDFEARGSISENYYSQEDLQYITNLFKEVTEINKEYIKTHIDPNILIDENTLHNDALIYKVNVKNNEKIIIFGDFHGSFHTFLRHIFRLRRLEIISSLTNWTLADGYRLIFLGDIIDRGQYGIEILTIIANLIKANNKHQLKIILNRGNHEEKSIYQVYGFSDELISKNLNENIFYSFFTYLSSAVVLENENKQRFWLSHGGIPFNDSTNSMYDIQNKLQTQKVIYIKVDDSDIPNQIRWNDFHDNNNKEISERGIGYVIGTTEIKQFLELNDIQFIIRGHQDNPNNSYILSNNDRYVPGQRLDISSNVQLIQKNPLNDIVFLNKLYVNDPFRIAVQGPIARVILNGQTWNYNPITGGQKISDDDIIYPVITLSTNNDRDRPMKYDSFGILRFDLTLNEMNQFDKETNLIDNRIKYYEIDYNSDDDSQ
ncbi:protein phosphatase 2A [Fadolivirus algeromassiliense]|jgi:hypothetical protein|uniref:Serine/threonine-protein phosphatase n=1 Tax=Fadolivirus FV1/VV64 TaxID=3070911 RepID=A0A7D3R060_9VIRU|nr:protein phosphatase 2A [Fadolivirus algeromassiliense]QKF93462.1 protein phosphatase 2A [Fadolivirus FV1/VV64]